MSDLDDLTLDYRVAFQRYLPHRSEAALTDGYELGRQAIARGVSLLDLVQVHQLNKVGRPAWWFYGKVLGRKHISKVMLKLYDKTVWLWKRVEGIFPWDGLSLIVIARRID